MGAGLVGIALLLATAALLLASLGRGEAVADLPPGRAFVVEVVDGDTIDVQLRGHRERIRLLGVDAPESVHPSAPIQCFGQEASTHLAALLPPGTEISLTRDVESHDHYDRRLAYVHTADGAVFVNQWLLDHGLADVALYEPNMAHRHELTTAAATARRNGVGLWAACDGPDQPLDPDS